MGRKNDKKREKRDGDGKFLPGHCGGPGRPKDPDKAKLLRKALLDAATEEQAIAVITKVYEQATTDRFDKDGCNIGADMSAAKLWIEQLVGRPKQQIELEGGQNVTSIQLAFIGKAAMGELEETTSAAASVQVLPSNGTNGNGIHRLPPE